MAGGDLAVSEISMNLYGILQERYANITFLFYS